MVLHSYLGKECVFVLDSQNVYRVGTLEPYNVECLLTMDYRDTVLTCITSRFSQSQNTPLLYLGDIKGTIRVFHPDDLIIQ